MCGWPHGSDHRTPTDGMNASHPQLPGGPELLVTQDPACAERQGAPDPGGRGPARLMAVPGHVPTPHQPPGVRGARSQRPQWLAPRLATVQAGRPRH